LLIPRIITGLIFGVALTATLLLLPTPAVAAVLGLLWLAGAWEWAGFAAFGSASRLAYSAAFAVCMVAVWLWQSPGLVLVFLGLVLVWWLLAFGAVLTFPRRFGALFVAVAGFVVLLPSWLLLGRLHGYPALGPALALTLLGTVWAADVGAYVFGRWLGRVKLAPAVSPGKTWEGVTGGLLAAGVTTGAAAWFLGLPVAGLTGLGVATGLVSVLGDLTQSMFKRNAGLKDSGKLLPGHGGVLDRIDSLTAAIPVFALGLELLGVTR
jgi:phosphatidate cytidylyltransferase